MQITAIVFVYIVRTVLFMRCFMLTRFITGTSKLMENYTIIFLKYEDKIKRNIFSGNLVDDFIYEYEVSM